MGLCILFPHLCGMKSVRVAEMKQILSANMVELEEELSKISKMSERIAVIEVARAEAIQILVEKGYNPYE